MLSLPYIALGIIQTGFLCLLPFVRIEFDLTRTQIGYYSTLFFVSAAMLSIFSGSIVDKFGPKKGILFGISVMTITMMFHGLTPSYEILLLLAFLIGLGASFITPSVTIGIIIEVPLEERAVSMGITQMGFGFGSIAGASLLPFLGENLGWRIAVQFAMLFTLLIGILVYKIYQYQSKSLYETDFDIARSKNGEKRSFKENILSLFSNKPLIRVCFFGVIFGASAGAVLSHFAIFLSEDLNLSRVAAGLGLGIFQFGGIISRPMWGWASDRIFNGNRLQSLFIIGLATGCIYLFFGLFLNNPKVCPIIVFIFSFILGCLALGWMGVHLAAVGEFAGDSKVGIATGLSLFFARIGMLIAPPIFGFIADIKENYQFGWLFFGVIIIVFSFVFIIGKFGQIIAR